MKKKLSGQTYELARMSMPRRLVPVLTGYRALLAKGEGRKAYEDVRRRSKEGEFESRKDGYQYGDDQYLTSLLFCLGGSTPVKVVAECLATERPTDYLEREVWNMRKEEPCTRVSLRVSVSQQLAEAYPQMAALVEGKMRSYKGDFYFHDMLTMAREVGRREMLWTVNECHTMNETIDVDGLAEWWCGHCEEEDVRKHIYGSEDDTWMGAALRTMCYDDDLYYRIDCDGRLHRLSRKEFTERHNRYVDSARAKAREMLEERRLKAA